MQVIYSSDNINKEEWNELVFQSPTGNWFQTFEAFDFLSSMPDVFSPFVVYIPKKAVCVGYVTVSNKFITQYLTRRAVVIGGPALADNITADELRLLLSSLRATVKSTSIFLEIRNFNDFSQWKDIFTECDFVYEPHLNYHLDCSSEELLFSNMHESRRRQVRKGLKNGAQIVIAQSEEDVSSYYNILKDLYKKKVKTPLFPEEFFLNFYRKNAGLILLVKYHNKIIGGIVCPVFKQHTIYEWFVCGLDNEFKDLYPSVIATYAAMNYGTTHSIARFDFMGAGKPNDGYGVRTFKQRFGGTEVEYGRYCCVFNHLLYNCGKLGVKLLKKIK